MIRELTVDEALEVMGGWEDAECHTYGTLADSSVEKAYFDGEFGISATSVNVSAKGSASSNGKVKFEGNYGIEVNGLTIQTPSLVNVNISASEAAYSTYRAGERAGYNSATPKRSPYC